MPTVRRLRDGNLEEFVNEQSYMDPLPTLVHPEVHNQFIENDSQHPIYIETALLWVCSLRKEEHTRKRVNTFMTSDACNVIYKHLLPQSLP